MCITKNLTSVFVIKIIELWKLTKYFKNSRFILYACKRFESLKSTLSDLNYVIYYCYYEFPSVCDVILVLIFNASASGNGLLFEIYLFIYFSMVIWILMLNFINS